MMCFHGTPFTPRDQMVACFAKRCAMVSFSDPRDIEVVSEICQAVALDNGAFHAWTNKRKYDFDGYLQWARHWVRHPSVAWCVIWDVIDGTEAENDALLESWPLPVGVSVPVYHLHESLDRLERLIAVYPRIMLGSSGQYKDIGKPLWWQRIAEVMDVVCDDDGMPRVKLHGARMLDPDIYSHLPLSSGDSTNAARNAGYDVAWNGPYAPPDRASRAMILMNRIESHASARRWCRSGGGIQRNMELLG
jgi:hypothetical protein